MTTTTHAPTATTVLVQDPTGILAANDGIIFYLTPCCKASVKGGESGPICRACHQRVPDQLAHAWLADDEDAWTEYRQQWVEFARPTTQTSEAIIDRVVAGARNNIPGRITP